MTGRVRDRYLVQSWDILLVNWVFSLALISNCSLFSDLVPRVPILFSGPESFQAFWNSSCAEDDSYGNVWQETTTIPLEVFFSLPLVPRLQRCLKVFQLSEGNHVLFVDQKGRKRSGAGNFEARGWRGRCHMLSRPCHSLQKVSKCVTKWREWCHTCYSVPLFFRFAWNKTIEGGDRRGEKHYYTDAMFQFLPGIIVAKKWTRVGLRLVSLSLDSERRCFCPFLAFSTVPQFPKRRTSKSLLRKEQKAERKELPNWIKGSHRIEASFSPR